MRCTVGFVLQCTEEDFAIDTALKTVLTAWSVPWLLNKGADGDASFVISLKTAYIEGILTKRQLLECSTLWCNSVDKIRSTEEDQRLLQHCCLFSPPTDSTALPVSPPWSTWLHFYPRHWSTTSLFSPAHRFVHVVFTRVATCRLYTKCTWESQHDYIKYH